jgi:hypothetical protein
MGNGLGEKTLFFKPKDIDTTYQNLAKADTPPHGFMYWVIGEDGKNGVYYTAALNKILKLWQQRWQFKVEKIIESL